MQSVAVIGTEEEAGPLINAAERLVGVHCALVPPDSGLDELDAIAFCGRREGCYQTILDAACSGKHLLIDHVVLRTGGEVDAVSAACVEADRQLFIAQPLRYVPSVQEVRRSVESGELGQPGLLRIHRWLAGQVAELEGSLLREIDLAIDLFTRPPSTVYAVSRDGDAWSRVVQIHLGFDGGGMALIDVATGLPEGDAYYSLSLIGADGSAYADDHHNMQLLFGGGSVRAERTGGAARHWTEPLRQFAAAITGPRQPAIGADDVRESLGVLEAVRRSVETSSAMFRRGDRYEPV